MSAVCGRVVLSSSGLSYSWLIRLPAMPGDHLITPGISDTRCGSCSHEPARTCIESWFHSFSEACPSAEQGASDARRYSSLISRLVSFRCRVARCRFRAGLLASLMSLVVSLSCSSCTAVILNAPSVCPVGDVLDACRTKQRAGQCVVSMRQAATHRIVSSP